MKLVTPNYGARAPVVNDSNYTDAKIGSPETSYQPSQPADPMVAPPKYVSPPGRRVQDKGLTNKRNPGGV